MKTLNFLKIAQLIVVAILFIFLLCIAFSIAYVECRGLYWLLGATLSVMIVYFYLELRLSYLVSNLSNEDLFAMKNTEYQNTQIEAFDYAVTEDNGHRTRFVRRYGQSVYDLFIKKGIISDYPLENKWQITNYARQLHCDSDFRPYSLEK